MRFAKFTITPNAVPTGGTYLLAGVSFAYNDTPTLSGWTLTSGSTYSNGALVFTCDTAGHQTQPTFDDSALIGGTWDGSINSDFTDGTDFVSGSPAQQLLYVADQGGNGPPISGTWSVGDWTGDISATPAPTGWTADTSLTVIASGGNITFTRTSDGSGQTPLSWDTSGIAGGDSGPWSGSVGQLNWIDGIDDTPATAAQDDIVLGSPGSFPPVAGLWNISGSSSASALSDAPDLTGAGWSRPAGVSLLSVYGGSPFTFTNSTAGSGRSALTIDTSGVNMSMASASLSLVDGFAPNANYITLGYGESISRYFMLGMQSAAPITFEPAWAQRSMKTIQIPILGG